MILIRRSSIILTYDDFAYLLKKGDQVLESLTTSLLQKHKCDIPLKCSYSSTHAARKYNIRRY